MVVLTLIASVLGGLGALLEGDSGPLLLGHWCVAAMVAGLIIYHSVKVLQFRMRLFQIENLAMCLAVTIAYQVSITLFGNNEFGQAIWLFIGLAFFWLPAAVTGAMVLWIARKVAENRSK